MESLDSCSGGKDICQSWIPELRLSLQNTKKIEKQTIRSLYREPNSWLMAIRYYAVLKWLGTIPNPPSLFILPLKKSSSLAMKTCTRHESQNMRRYGDINHERGKKKSSQISFGTPGDGTWDSQPAAFAGRCLDSAARCIYSFFFYEVRGRGLRCISA